MVQRSNERGLYYFLNGPRMEESKPASSSVAPHVGASGPVSGAGRAGEALFIGIVERMLRGDQQAMSELYDHTSSVIYGLALRVVRNREDAEEVVLDTYSKAWRTIHSYDRSRGSVMTWLILMARSIAIDRLRSGATRASKTEPLDEPRAAVEASAEPGPESAAVFGEQRQRIQAALNDLPAEQREVIELAFFGGLSHSELAEKTGLPLGTVKTRVRLGLARLRDALGDLG